MEQKITSVDKNSIGEELGIRPGDLLLSIDGEPVYDIVDYEQLCAKEKLVLTLRTGKEEWDAEVEKDLYEPLGLSFESGLMSPLKSCKNHCMFCFIDQMPKGIRKTLEVKDDDWRMSLIMGNYVTLTNVDDEEFERIIRRRVSPLYISVHATDPEVRKTMMRNPTAVRIMERLTRLKEEGLQFHCQVVLCPGHNDGEVLEKTIRELGALYPAAQSLAVVPVGLTKHREGLAPLRVHTKEEAAAAIDMIEGFQKEFLKKHDTRFVFASDEMYLAAGRELPEEETFEDYAQLENGVGLLRKFEFEFQMALDNLKKRKVPLYLDSASGRIAAPFMQQLFRELEEKNIFITVHPIRNDFFGETVTVSGLVTAGDIANQLAGTLKGKALLIPSSMMREREDVFLDGKHKTDLESALGIPVISMCPWDGETFIDELSTINL
ncbi:MAG: DUF512 domain-containing protein [Clostridia bacterium]|nr:DUF512 domain-containing protein [Clostridia bacterium]